MTSTRQRILEEAFRQLPDKGYAAFTLAAVREAVGISSGSLFHAFPSKPALAAAVFVEGMADYQVHALDAIDAAPDPERALRAWVAAHLGWIEDNRALASFLFSSVPPEVGREIAGPLADYNARFYAALATLFSDARSAGLVGDLPSKVAHALCIAPAHDYGRLWTRGQADVPPREVVAVMQDAAIAALASTVAPKRRGRVPAKPATKSRTAGARPARKKTAKKERRT